MRRVKILGIAMLAMLAISALAASASLAATPEFLPEATAGNPITFKSETVKGTHPVLETLAGTKVECEKATNTGSITGLKAGTVKITFEKCKELTAGSQCTGLSDTTAGNITTEGNLDLVAGLLKKTKEEVVAAAVLLTKSIHFTCLSGIILIEVPVLNAAKETNCAAAHIEPVGKLTKVLTVKFLQEKGDADIEEIATNLKEAKKIKCTLSVEVNHNAAETAAELAEAELKGFEQGKKAIEVLIDA